MNIKATHYLLDAANKSKKIKPIEGESAKKLKEVLKNMLQDFQSRCEDCGITSFVVYGSALGAYRHKGFIPWDDDVDVAVSREDWNKIKEKFDTYFSDKYDLEGPNYNNKDTFAAWGKIFLKGTRFVEVLNMNTPYNKGLYLDIFIVDGLADNGIVRFFDYGIARTIRFVCNSMTYYHYPSELINEMMSVSWQTKTYLIFRKVIGFLFSWISHRKLINIYDAFISRHTTSKYTIINYDHAISARGWWFPVKKMQFENIQVNVPNNIKDYLEYTYGPTYMELPPEDKREQHFCVDLNFGKY